MDAFMMHGLLGGDSKHRKHHNQQMHMMKSHRSRSLNERRGHITNVPVVARNYMTPTGHSLKKLHDMTLCMQVMDYDRFSHDDPIGEVLLPMKDVKFDRRPVYWKHLQEPTVQHKEVRGEIMLSLCYLPESSRLTVVVVKAKELPSKDMTGSSDPYVKLWLVHQGNKWEKRKTTIKNQTLQPVFNETFSFTVSKDKIQETQLVASVMDYDIIGSNDEIGHVILGKRGSDTGQKQWKDLTDKPNYPHAMWHKLSPKW